MKKSSKVLSSVLIASMLVGSLTACGKSEKKTEATEANETTEAAEATEATTEEIKGEALVDPAYIHPGSYNDLEDPFGDTSDYWYPEGDVNADYFIMFGQTSHDFSNIGLDIEIDTLNDKGTYVNQDFGGAPLNEKDGHVTIDEPMDLNDGRGTVDFDITFQDNFTCYDFVTGTTFMRAHRQWGCKPQSWYDDAFSGMVAYRDFSTDSQYITLNDDHTFVEQIIESNGDVSEEMTGTWEIKASNVCWLIYDNPEDAGPDAVDITQALGVEDEGGEYKDVTKGVWPLEFEITEDGKVTAFGLYPKYNDDYTETIGYESTFLITSVDEMENAKQAEADAEAAAEAAEAQAKEDAKNSGSPYEQPDDKKDLSGVNLDQTPDIEVVDGAWDYDTFNDFKSKYDKDEYKGMIVKLTGELGTISTWREVKVKNETGRLEKTVTIEIVDGDGSTIGEDGATVTVVGVVWGDKKLYTDMAHISVE
ncbi:MAG: hypothetical protein IJ167_06445 [Lachnospiraceae bacterium]|nr:hypothetical protein [Lachnospiraceae bacterium]